MSESDLDPTLAMLEAKTQALREEMESYRVSLQLECRHPHLMMTPPYYNSFTVYRVCCACRLAEQGATDRSREGDLPFMFLADQEGRVVDESSWLEVHTYRTALILDHHKKEITEGRTTLKEILKLNSAPRT